MKNYIPNYGNLNENEKIELQKVTKNGIAKGTELYIANIIPRDKSITSIEEKKLGKIFKEGHVKRLHMSYWGETSDFLQKLDVEGLKGRFGSDENIINYFGDLTGNKIYSRWAEEYALAYKFGLESVTFHLIDYFHIDGLWRFTNNRNDIVLAQAKILNTLLRKLEEKDLLKKGPLIEIENAGFCLEYGVQTAADFEIVFQHINDMRRKVRIAWDINHLLHAIGFDGKNMLTKFFLTKAEKTLRMEEIEAEYGSDQQAFINEWLELNILHPSLLSKINALHLSDSDLRTETIFENGQLTEKYLSEILTFSNDEEKEAYGAKIVGTYFDSHIPVGPNKSSIVSILRKILRVNSGINLMHEIKGEITQDVFQKQMMDLELNA